MTKKELLIRDINEIVGTIYSELVSYSNINLLNNYRETTDSHIDLVHDVIIDITNRATSNEENIVKFGEVIKRGELKFYLFNAVIKNCKMTTYPFIRNIKRLRKKIDLNINVSDEKIFENCIYNNINDDETRIIEDEKVKLVNDKIKMISLKSDPMDILMFKIYMYNNLTYEYVGGLFGLNKSQVFARINKIKLKIKENE